MQYPKVNIESLRLENNEYVDGRGCVYSAVKLIEHSKQYPVFELPLAGLDLTRGFWDINDFDDFVYHVKRVANASLEYPILLDKYGTIADGAHRIAKAIVLGKRTIKAIRLESMPDHDRIQTKKE